MNKTQVQVRIPDDLLERIDQKAFEEVRSRSNMIIWILAEHFNIRLEVKE